MKKYYASQDDEKDDFREWLENKVYSLPFDACTKEGKGMFIAYKTALDKYNELTTPKEEPKPEPKPLFEIGEKTWFGTKPICFIKGRKYKYNFNQWYYDVSPVGHNDLVYNNIAEYILMKLPKTKLVFSLEKWVEKRMKSNGSLYIINYLDSTRKYDNKTIEEMKHLGVGSLIDEPDLFVEVEDKA